MSIITKPFKQIRLIKQFTNHIFPLIDNELDIYIEKAKKIPDKVLAKQAKNSIITKKFHCQGGGIYTLYPNAKTNEMAKFIVAYQTISDYLDNLCDRTQFADERAFRMLHKAMTDALDPSEGTSDYYKYYPYKDDGGYLDLLVKNCKDVIRTLPAYFLIKDKALRLARLYSDLQVYKHLDINIRKDKMEKWFERYIKFYPEINGWEFSAATGSTLCIFLFVAIAMNKDLSKKEVHKIVESYFPWICGLHILLDYYIDLYEDMKEGDLNFINYYKNSDEKEKRISFFLDKALDSALSLKYPIFHLTVVEGLMAMYLSDPKAYLGEHKIITQRLLRKCSYFTRFLYFTCLKLRKKQKL